MTSSVHSGWRTPAVVLVCAGLVLSLAMGIRHGFGLFLQPMSMDLHWGRETFALAMAVQNLMWGVTQPFTGMLADKFGTAKVMLGGVTLYALGLVTMAHATSPVMLVLTCGVLIGAGLGGRIYDQTGSYDIVWGISIALGVAAGLLNLPIDEREIRRPATVPA